MGVLIDLWRTGGRTWLAGEGCDPKSGRGRALEEVSGTQRRICVIPLTSLVWCPLLIGPWHGLNHTGLSLLLAVEKEAQFTWTR